MVSTRSASKRTAKTSGPPTPVSPCHTPSGIRSPPPKRTKTRPAPASLPPESATPHYEPTHPFDLAAYARDQENTLSPALLTTALRRARDERRVFGDESAATNRASSAPPPASLPEKSEVAQGEVLSGPQNGESGGNGHADETGPSQLSLSLQQPNFDASMTFLPATGTAAPPVSPVRALYPPAVPQNPLHPASSVRHPLSQLPSRRGSLVHRSVRPIDALPPTATAQYQLCPCPKNELCAPQTNSNHRCSEGFHLVPAKSTASRRISTSSGAGSGQMSSPMRVATRRLAGMHLSSDFSSPAQASPLSLNDDHADWQLGISDASMAPFSPYSPQQQHVRGTREAALSSAVYDSPTSQASASPGRSSSHFHTHCRRESFSSSYALPRSPFSPAVSHASAFLPAALQRPQGGQQTLSRSYSSHSQRSSIDLGSPGGGGKGRRRDSYVGSPTSPVSNNSFQRDPFVVPVEDLPPEFQHLGRRLSDTYSVGVSLDHRQQTPSSASLLAPRGQLPYEQVSPAAFSCSGQRKMSAVVEQAGRRGDVERFEQLVVRPEQVGGMAPQHTIHEDEETGDGGFEPLYQRLDAQSPVVLEQRDSLPPLPVQHQPFSPPDSEPFLPPPRPPSRSSALASLPPSSQLHDSSLATSSFSPHRRRRLSSEPRGGLAEIGAPKRLDTTSALDGWDEAR
ncbi:hypothetical protein JCM11641_003746 [Rhodosporidiobolus odoratus]